MRSFIKNVINSDKVNPVFPLRGKVSCIFLKNEIQIHTKLILLNHHLRVSVETSIPQKLVVAKPFPRGDKTLSKEGDERIHLAIERESCDAIMSGY